MLLSVALWSCLCDIFWKRVPQLRVKVMTERAVHVDGVCGIVGGEDKCVQGFGVET